MLKKIISLSLLATSLFSQDAKVLLFSGSTRQGSFNQQLIEQTAQLLQIKQAPIESIKLSDYPMPFYDADLEKNQGMPEQARRLRQKMMASDTIIISTPEYNGSVPAVLKNTLDWASRSLEGKPSRDAYKGKKFILMSASPSPYGGARALAHLKAIIENVGGEVVSADFSLKNAHEAFTTEGKLKDMGQVAHLLGVDQGSITSGSL